MRLHRLSCLLSSPPQGRPALHCHASSNQEVAGGDPCSTAYVSLLAVLLLASDLTWLRRYVTNTRVKFVLVLEDPVPKDDEMRTVRRAGPLFPAEYQLLLSHAQL